MVKRDSFACISSAANGDNKYLLVLHKTSQYYVTEDIMLRCHGYLQGIID